MDLYIKRFHKGSEGVSGHLHINGSFYCFTLERPDMDNQQRISCIPIGRYNMVLRKEVTEMTTKYRNKYDYFTWHLMLEKVKGRSGIYIHVGNSINDSYGCILVGEQVNSIHFLSSSRKAYKPFYAKVTAAIERGEAVTLTIE